jgi:nitrous oxide reductase accessory protein NosL
MRGIPGNVQTISFRKGAKAMKKRNLLILAVIVLSGWTAAAVADDIGDHPACPFCGMDRAKFAHSRVYIRYDGGSTLGACSIHCAAVDMAVNIDKTPVSIQVGDYNTKKLIDAEKAFWVIGGGQPGVMTGRAKWAFENKGDADAFIKQHGGTAANFDEVLEAAYEDMYKDTKMIRERRKMKREKKQ